MSKAQEPGQAVATTGPSNEMEWYRLVAEASQDVIFIINRDDTVRYVNPAAAAVIGGGPSAIVGKPRESLFGPETAQRQGQVLREVFETGRAVVRENAHEVRGRTVWLNAHLIPLKDAEGKVYAVLGISRDITYHKTTELELRASETKYRELVESLQEGVWAIDQNGITTFVNHPMAAMLGYTVEEMLGKSILNFVDERGKRLAMCKLEIRRQGIREQYDSELICKDGSRLHVALQAGPVFDGNGHYIGSIAGVLDITRRKRIEEENLRLKQRYEEFVNNLPLGVYRNTPGEQGRFLEINSALVRIFEAGSREELMSRPVSSLYADPSQRRVFSEKLMHYGAVKGEELQLLTLKGRSFPAAITAIRKQDSDGGVYFDGILEDITERKQTEIALQESRSSLNAILDAVPTPIFCKDTEGVYTACNAAFVRFLGMPQERIIGSGVYDLAPKNLADIYHWADQQLMKGSGDQVYETRVLHADGTLHDVMFFKSPLRDDRGTLRGLVGVILDITERKRIEEALRQSEERYRDLVENVNDVLYAIDREGLFTYISPIVETIGGYLPQEVVGHSFMDFTHPEDRRQASENFQKVMSGQNIMVEIRGRRKDGRYIWLRVSMRPRQEGDTVVGVRGVLSDITPQKEAAEHIRKLNDELHEQAILLERRRMEAELLVVSERERIRIGQDLHDGLTQNLAGLAFLCKGLHQKLSAHSSVEASDAARIGELLEEALTEARHLARGLYPVEIEANGLMSALQELAGSIRRHHEIACVFQCGKSVLIQDNNTSVHLYRIAQEAVRNAIRHARATRVTIKLTRMEGEIVLSIRDNGKGIARGRRSEGGMGLRVMASRAQMIGAKLDVDRGRGGGTVVTCRWPIPVAATPPSQA